MWRKRLWSEKPTVKADNRKGKIAEGIQQESNDTAMTLSLCLCLFSSNMFLIFFSPSVLIVILKKGLKEIS